MRGGDKIYLAEESEACLMVLGENSRTIFLPNGSIPLKQVLAEEKSCKGKIQIIRGSLPKTKVYILDWEHVLYLPNESLLLMPGDLVQPPH
jgi:polysaccharide export outer membrane protein